MDRPGNPRRAWKQRERLHGWIRDQLDPRVAPGVDARLRPFVFRLEEAALKLDRTNLETLAEALLGCVDTYHFETSTRLRPVRRLKALDRWDQALRAVLELMDDREARAALANLVDDRDDVRLGSRLLREAGALQRQVKLTRTLVEQAKAQESRASRRSELPRDRLIDRALALGREAGAAFPRGGAARLVRVVLEEARAYVPSGGDGRAFRTLVARHVARAGRRA